MCYTFCYVTTFPSSVKMDESTTWKGSKESRHPLTTNLKNYQLKTKRLNIEAFDGNTFTSSNSLNFLSYVQSTKLYMQICLVLMFPLYISFFSLMAPISALSWWTPHFSRFISSLMIFSCTSLGNTCKKGQRSFTYCLNRHYGHNNYDDEEGGNGCNLPK